MKIIILFIIFCSNQIMAQVNLWEIQFQTLDGKTINMHDFKGKKILIASVSPEKLRNGSLKFLDSVQAAYPAAVVIAIPAADYGDTLITDIIMNEIKNSVSYQSVVTVPALVKKESGINQFSLAAWLTHHEINGHFDADVSTDYQVFIISESGILYTELQEDITFQTITQLFSQADIKE